MKLEIGLLGVFTASLDGVKIQLHPGQAALVAYLALARGRLVPRTRVAGALWPDLSEERAKANLSTAIWRLRGALSKHGFLQSIIQASPDSCGLDPEQYWLDVEQFVRGSIRSDGRHLSLEALGRAAHALDLYRGDLLEDWDVEWCRLEREHLRERYVECARVISEGLAERGRFDLALRYARLAVAREPMDERSQRNLIRLLFLSGDRVSALHHFNGFARLVRSELGAEPDDETLQLVRHIRRGVAGSWVTASNGEARTLSIHPERIPLVGRVQEKSELDGWIEAVFAGSGGGVLLLGESGIGKTRLVEWAMEEWCVRGGEYACGRCVEFNEPVPYQPVLDALERHVARDDVSRVVRYLEPVEPLTRAHGESDLPGDEPQNELPLGKLSYFRRLAAAIEQAARSRPFLLVIEDLQWADTGTLDFVAYMLERSRSSRLGILLSAWPPSSRRHHREWVSRLSRQCTIVIRLEPLTEVETGDLASRLLEGVPVSREAHAWILRETEGNPLFVVETLRLLCQRGQIGQLAAPSFAGANLPLSVPDRVRSAVGQRLGLIRRDSLRLAEAASVLGRAFDDEMLRSITGMSENRLSRAVEDLVAVGILVREKSHLLFSHEKIRAVCYDRIPQARKRAYHAKAAAALAERPQLASHLLAWHQESAGQWHLATKSWIQAASEARAVCAFDETLKSYRRALECLRQDTTVSVDERGTVEMRVLTRLDEALGVLGHLSDRRVVLSKLGELCRRGASPSARMEYFVRSAHFQEHIGDFSMAAALARKARRVAQLECNEDAEARALVVLSRAYLRGGRHLRALCAARLALQKARGERSDVLVEALYQAAAANIALAGC